MATVFDTLALPRCAAAPLTAPLSARRVALPLSRGLKLAPSLSPSSAASLRSVPALRGVSRRRPGSRIVCEAQETTVQVAQVTDATWDSLVLGSELPVLVEFWAPWCGPCRMMHPIFDDLAKEYAGKVKFYKVNTDDNQGIATNYGIRSIPTVMVFKEGDKKDAIIGAVPKSTLTTSIEKFL